MSHGGSKGTTGPIFAYFSSPRLLVETDVLSNWPNPHTGFLSNVIKAIMEKRAMKKSLELPPLFSKNNSKLHHIPERSSEISTTIKNLRMQGC